MLTVRVFAPVLTLPLVRKNVPLIVELPPSVAPAALFIARLKYVPAGIVCAVTPTKLIVPVADVSEPQEKAPATVTVPFIVQALVTASVLPELMVNIRDELSIKLFIATFAAEIIGLFGNAPVGRSMSLPEFGTVCGFQFVATFQFELVAPVHVAVFVTVKIAEAVKPFPPLVEVAASVVFVNAPALVPLTRTLIEQLPLADIEPPDKVILLAAAVGAKVPPQVFAAVGVASTSIPDGKLSATPTPDKATVFAAGLVIEIVRVEKPLFCKMVVGENDLAIVGGATTVKFAVAVAPVPSSVVERVVVLFFTPAVVPVTSTLKVQFALVANVPPASETELAPALAVIVPPQVPV